MRVKTWLVSLVMLTPAMASATVVDSVNFAETSLANLATQTTSMAWAPDGTNRLFVTAKDGRVLIVKNGSLLATPFSSDSVFTNSECGLLGIVFDPSFLVNGYVYVFETVSSSEQQIVRYTASGDVGLSRTVIIAGLPSRGVNHDGGGLGFGPDGKLYWSIGDNGNFVGVNTDLSSLAAKVGRANRDGTAPGDNPFADGAGPNNEYIWARGLRNPFALAFQPGTGALWVDVAGTNYEQIFVVGAGSHAGYSTYEDDQPAGFIPPAVVYRTNSSDSRTLLAGGAVRSGNVATFTTSAAHGFRKGGKVTIAGVTDASFNGVGFVLATPNTMTFTVAQVGANASSGGGTATSEFIGGAVTGGDFWSSSALPSAYRGNYFFGDYNSGRVERVTLAADNSVSSVEHFATDISSSVDVATGPDGALYLLTVAGQVERVSYSATSQGLVVAPLHLRFDEGGRGLVNVRLAKAPASNVTVNVALAGDTDVVLSSAATLSFTTANWATPQQVRLQSGSDNDAVDDQATLTLTSSGLASESVGLKITDLVKGGSASAPVPALAGAQRGLLGALLLGLGLLFSRKRERRAGSVL